MQIDPTVRYRHYRELFAMVNGQRYPLAELPSRSVAIDGTRSTCDAPIRDLLPQDVAGMPITVEYQVNKKRGVFYQGIVGQRNYGVPPVSRTVQAYDILSHIEQAEGEECGSAEGLLFDNTPWPTAMRQVLNRAGIADAEIASIYDPGSTFNVGSVEPICHTADESLTSIYRALLTMVGAVGWCLPASGQVKIERFSTIPPASPSITISNTASNAYRWNKADYVATGRERIVKRFTCTGGEVENGVAVESTWVAPDIEVGINDSESCEYWQTQAQVDAMAQWYGEQACREEITVEVEVPADMGWLPGLAVALTVGKLNLASKPAIITAVRTDGVRSTLTCAMGDSKINGYLDTFAPICDFALLIVAERVLISGQPQTIYDVYVDASSSYDPDGELVSYAWSVSGATPLNTVAQAVQTTIVLDTLVGVEISLTVTDDNNAPNTDSLTQALDAPGVQVWTRVLSTACSTDGWRILVDQEGWKSFARAGQSCVSVPRFNDSGPLLSLWDDGQVWRWEDYSANPVHIGTLPGTSGDTIAITEGKPDDIFASAGAVLYRSSDGGATWELLWTFSGTITTIEAGYNDPTYIRVSVGNQLWHSYSSGLAWDVAASGPAGTTVRAIANSDAGHLATLTGGTVPTLFDEGHSVNWAGATTPPAELDATSALLTEPGYVVGHSASNALWKLLWNGSQFDASDIAATPTGPVALLRDGLLPDVIYGASNPTFKLLTLSSLYDLDTIASQQIGYGALYVPPPVPASGRLVLSFSRGAGWNGGLASDSTIAATGPDTWEVISSEEFKPRFFGYKPGVFYAYRSSGDDRIIDKYAYSNGAWTYTASYYTVNDPATWLGIRLARVADTLYVYREGDSSGEIGSLSPWSGTPVASWQQVIAWKPLFNTATLSAVTSDDQVIVTGRDNETTTSWFYAAFNGSVIGLQTGQTEREDHQPTGGYFPYHHGAVWSDANNAQFIGRWDPRAPEGPSWARTHAINGATRTQTTLYGQTVIGAFHSETYPDTAWMAVGQTVYRVTSRGTGTAITTHTAPSAIVWFVVTHASDGTDMLVVVCEGANDALDFYTSYDSGATWSKEATLTRGFNFSIQAAFILPEA